MRYVGKIMAVATAVATQAISALEIKTIPYTASIEKIIPNISCINIGDNFNHSLTQSQGLFYAV